MILKLYTYIYILVCTFLTYNVIIVINIVPHISRSVLSGRLKSKIISTLHEHEKIFSVTYSWERKTRQQLVAKYISRLFSHLQRSKIEFTLARIFALNKMFLTRGQTRHGPKFVPTFHPRSLTPQGWEKRIRAECFRVRLHRLHERYRGVRSRKEHARDRSRAFSIPTPFLSTLRRRFRAVL